MELIRRDYYANGGWETFLSYEDPEQDILIGLLRLRKCSAETFCPELKDKASVVRELHVYGSVVPVSARDPTRFQHQGFGTLLMEEAERIARDEHMSIKLAVISGKTLFALIISPRNEVISFKVIVRISIVSDLQNILISSWLYVKD